MFADFVVIQVDIGLSITHSTYVICFCSTQFVTRLTRRVPLVEQELRTLPKQLSSPRFLVGFV
jgi:hypothetical protein